MNKTNKINSSENRKAPDTKQVKTGDDLRDNDTVKETPIGLGDHVPAFLLRPPK